MPETLADKTSFTPDSWDVAGASAEAVKNAINAIIGSSFGVGSVSDIQRNAIQLAAFNEYKAQSSLKIAAEAAVRAADYLDVPESALYKNAESTRIAYENIAKSLRDEASQLLKSSASDQVLASKFTSTVNLLGPILNGVQLAAALSSGDVHGRPLCQALNLQ